MSLVIEVLSFIKSIILFPVIWLKYSILWLKYRHTVKDVEFALAKRFNVEASISDGDPKYKNMIISIYNDIEKEFIQTPKNYSLLKKKIDNFYEIMYSNEAKRKIDYRIFPENAKRGQE